MIVGRIVPKSPISEFTYSYKRPSPIRWYAWEANLPEGHRLVLKVRRSRIAPVGKHLAYQARCTCRKWSSPDWHRDNKVARKDFLLDHINPLRRQERLFSEIPKEPNG
jgi:hypothetical protein